MLLFFCLSFWRDHLSHTIVMVMGDRMHRGWHLILCSYFVPSADRSLTSSRQSNNFIMQEHLTELGPKNNSCKDGGPEILVSVHLRPLVFTGRIKTQSNRLDPALWTLKLSSRPGSVKTKLGNNHTVFTNDFHMSTAKRSFSNFPKFHHCTSQNSHQ